MFISQFIVPDLVILPLFFWCCDKSGYWHKPEMWAAGTNHWNYRWLAQLVLLNDLGVIYCFFCKHRIIFIVWRQFKTELQSKNIIISPLFVEMPEWNHRILHSDLRGYGAVTEMSYEAMCPTPITEPGAAPPAFLARWGHTDTLTMSSFLPRAAAVRAVGVSRDAPGWQGNARGLPGWRL